MVKVTMVVVAVTVVVEVVSEVVLVAVTLMVVVAVRALMCNGAVIDTFVEVLIVGM